MKSNLEQLKEDIKAGKQMILFTGAGINMSQGADLSWEAVLNHLFKIALSRVISANNVPRDLIEEMNKAICDCDDSKRKYHIKELLEILTDKYELRKLSAAEFTPPIIISIVKKYLEGSYIQHLQSFLYERCNKNILCTAFKKCYRIKKNNNEPNQEPNTNGKTDQKLKFHSLYQLARMIVLSSNIKAVVTYNFDNFLTQAIAILYKDKEEFFNSHEIDQINLCHPNGLRPRDIYGNIYDQAMCDGDLFIYHIHGYIPPPYKVEDVSGCEIVFSLEDFYEMTKNDYSWQTTTQLHFLSHYSCIFAGISVSEVTTQRMLQYAKSSGNRERIYYLTSYSKPKRIRMEQVHEELMRLKYTFLKSYGLTLLYEKNGFEKLYKEVSDGVIEAEKQKQEQKKSKTKKQ